MATWVRRRPGRVYSHFGQVGTDIQMRWRAIIHQDSSQESSGFAWNRYANSLLEGLGNAREEQQPALCQLRKIHYSTGRAGERGKTRKEEERRGNGTGRKLLKLSQRLLNSQMLGISEICLCVCVFMSMCMHVSVFMCLCVCVMCVSGCACVYASVSVCVCMFQYIYVSVCLYA